MKQPTAGLVQNALIEVKVKRAYVSPVRVSLSNGLSAGTGLELPATTTEVPCLELFVLERSSPNVFRV